MNKKYSVFMRVAGVCKRQKLFVMRGVNMSDIAALDKDIIIRCQNKKEADEYCAENSEYVQVAVDSDDGEFKEVSSIPKPKKSSVLWCVYKGPITIPWGVPNLSFALESDEKVELGVSGEMKFKVIFPGSVVKILKYPEQIKAKNIRKRIFDDLKEIVHRCLSQHLETHDLSTMDKNYRALSSYIKKDIEVNVEEKEGKGLEHVLELSGFELENFIIKEHIDYSRAEED